MSSRFHSIFSHNTPFLRYLFSLWPNVQISAEIDPDDENFEEEHKQEILAIELTNDYLARLSCCNRDPTIKYEDVKLPGED
jgi:hypothetical protein